MIFSDNNNLRREEEPLRPAVWLAWLESVFAAVPKVCILSFEMAFDGDDMFSCRTLRMLVLKPVIPWSTYITLRHRLLIYSVMPLYSLDSLGDPRDSFYM